MICRMCRHAGDILTNTDLTRGEREKLAKEHHDQCINNCDCQHQLTSVIPIERRPRL